MLDKDHQFVRIGKLGNKTDIAIYHYTTGSGLRLNLIDPIMYPDRVKPLSKSIGMSDVILLIVNDLDRLTGELMLVSVLAGKPLVVYSELFTKTDLKPYLGLAKGYEVFSDKIELFSHLEKYVPPKQTSLKIFVDQVLQVKSVGTVLLGSVKSGGVKVHDDVRLLPSDVLTNIRSIQVHDHDVKSAEQGSRVGLAVKARYDDVKDTTLVVPKEDQVNVVDHVKLLSNFTQFYNKRVEVGRTFMFGYDLTFVSGKVVSFEEVSNNPYTVEMTVRLEKPIYHPHKVLIFDPNTVPRVVGSATVID